MLPAQLVPQLVIAFQLTVGLVEIPVAPFAGEERVGALGAVFVQAAAVMVKLKVAVLIRLPLVPIIVIE